MAVWFASGAVTARLGGVVGAGAAALLANALQAGFVAGTLGSAALALPDRVDPRRLFSLAAVVAAGATGALAMLPPTGAGPLALRFVTGACMAGVYPVGMRIAATWAQAGAESGDGSGRRGDLGLLIGLLVGALTLGSASPHALAAIPGLGWRSIYGAAAALALAAGVAIHAAGLGPQLVRAARPDWRLAAQAWRNRPLLLANAGYLGHMWELYAMWAWLGAFLHARFGAAGGLAEGLTFAAIAAGALGAGLGGWLADRWGRTAVTMGAMGSSAACALLIGALPASAPLIGGVALVWGVVVVADSAQFSASIAELSPPHAVGTLLTVQTCAGFLLTTVSIQLVPVLVQHGGWAGAFGMLAIGPLLGCWCMARLRADPATRRLAGGRR